MSNIERQRATELAERYGLRWFKLSPPGRYVLYVPAARFDDFPRLEELAKVPENNVVTVSVDTYAGVIVPWPLFDEIEGPEAGK